MFMPKTVSTMNDHVSTRAIESISDVSTPYKNGVEDQNGFKPSIDEIETPRGTAEIGKDRCIELCASLRRLVDADVLSVPTATVAKSSLFHTRTTVSVDYGVFCSVALFPIAMFYPLLYILAAKAALIERTPNHHHTIGLKSQNGFSDSRFTLLSGRSALCLQASR